MQSRVAALVIRTLLLTAAASMARGAQPHGLDAQISAAVSRCAEEGDDTVRHACLDQALRDGGLLTRSSPAAATPAPPAAPVPGAPLAWRLLVPAIRPPRNSRIERPSALQALLWLEMARS
jgi:hypothetical protein